MQEIAGPASIFVFWLATSAGVVAAMAMTNPETLEPIPSDILRWLPNVLAAGLILLVGYALSVVVSGSLSRGFRQATGSAAASLSARSEPRSWSGQSSWLWANSAWRPPCSTC